ncbi:MAG: hypothetical protein ACK5MP_05685 [Nostocoides sp.]
MGSSRRESSPQQAGATASARRQDLLAAGVTDGSLRRAGLAHPTHGVWAATSPTSLADLLADLVPALPAHSAFSHTTAADIHGMPLPSHIPNVPGEGIDPLAVTSTVHVTTATEAAQTRRPGWVGHRGIERRKICWVDGVPLTSVRTHYATLPNSRPDADAYWGTLTSWLSGTT